MMNSIVVIGRLTADPELRYTSNGTAVASFTVAVERDRKGQNGEKVTDFLNVIAWQKTGELCAEYLGKGRLCAVRGRLETRSYENKEGQKIRVYEIVAENVQFLDSKKEGQASSKPVQDSAKQHSNHVNNDPFADSTSLNIDYDDLPF